MCDALRARAITVSEVCAIACTLRFDGREVEQADARACVMHERNRLHVCVAVQTQQPGDMRELFEAVGDVLATCASWPIGTWHQHTACGTCTLFPLLALLVRTSATYDRHHSSWAVQGPAAAGAHVG